MPFHKCLHIIDANEEKRSVFFFRCFVFCIIFFLFHYKLENNGEVVPAFAELKVIKLLMRSFGFIVAQPFTHLMKSTTIMQALHFNPLSTRRLFYLCVCFVVSKIYINNSK